ncbi:hypothetical protein PV327_001159 [Microctonus hyperodae]|uniref:Bromo domain-containing protein n=1 Tax=Microctonus hyperodae TaxID=165561 RepID=A0AA39L317_MICHY|nr:hypothetical protein PV327_001159 [Microctonus hyperodae]
MASIQDRLKIKRESCDTWSTREQLCLASSVLKSGDQNWIGVSRSLKPFAEKEALRPPDWFSQKSCAVQYAILLENADTPKRKKRESGETTGESIVKRLRQERIAELGQILAFQRDEYQQLKAEVNLLKSGTVTDEKLQKMWMAIEQEEREQEQKARAHSAWLAKRQQKLDVLSPQTTPISIPKKVTESNNETQESIDSTNGSEKEKKSRSGQTALLTSLLTSPSPTTQIPITTSTAQVTSPTIASLLGSNTKIHTTQPSPRMSPQLHQIVTSAIPTTTTERPSAGAPTLSMLLALPANLSRGTLSSLQTTTVQTQVTDVTTTPTRLSTKQITQNSPVTRSPIVTATAEIPETENMVQIIDHIDDVIGKDKIADVIDKDEINEIIGDIEELIKEEITGNPQTATSTPSIIETLPVAIESKPVQVQERSAPRDIDEPVSLSSSSESELAIEEIDQSTSNIAKIIGAAIEPSEPKVIVETISENDIPVENKTEEIPSVNSEETEKINDNAPMEIEEYVPAPGINKKGEKIEDKKETTVENKETIDNIVKNVEKTLETQSEVIDKIVEEKVEKPQQEEIPMECKELDKIEHEISKLEENNDETIVESKEEEVAEIEQKVAKTIEIEEKSPAAELIEMKSEVSDIKDVQDQSSIVTKGEEIISEAPNDSSDSQELKEEIPDNKDAPEKTADKSQDEEKPVKSPEISESKEEEVVESESTSKEETNCKIEETSEVISTASMPIESEDVPEAKPEEMTNSKLEFEDKVEDTKSNVEDIIVKQELIEEKSNATEEMKAEEVTPEQVIEVKEVDEFEEIKELKKTKEVQQIKEAEEVKEIVNVPEIVKEIKVKEVKETKEIKETKVEKPEKIEKLDKTEKIGKDDESKKKKEEEIVEIKKEEPTSNTADDVEMEEEESSLTKLSAGRAMKTYSKKQNIAVDSEPETESSGEGADYRAWKKAVMLVYNRLATHKYASVFLRPITEDQAPGYHSVIFRPMDLSTIKKNIDNGTIRSTMHFQRDVMLMFQNAIMYNKHDTFVYQMAVSMQEECLQHMQILVEVTGEGPFRRETRTAASSSSETSESSAIKRKRSHITPSPHDTESPRMKKRRKSEND